MYFIDTPDGREKLSDGSPNVQLHQASQWLFWIMLGPVRFSAKSAISLTGRGMHLAEAVPPSAAFILSEYELPQ